jgi:hypothetical protein
VRYSAPKLLNCIVWGNHPVSFYSDEFSMPDVRYCDIEGKAVVPGEGNTNADPLFARPGVIDFQRFRTLTIEGREFRLPDFIVEAPDYHLQPDSPAIDAGISEGAPTKDIEGRGRPCGKGVDIGAYEYGECPPAVQFLRGDANADTKTDISDAIATLGFLFLGSPEKLDCQKAADVDDSGKIDISDAVYLLGYQFLGGPAPPPPYPVCGVDETTDELTCESFAGCP